jgi:hypothetical protein
LWALAVIVQLELWTLQASVIALATARYIPKSHSVSSSAVKQPAGQFGKQGLAVIRLAVVTAVWATQPSLDL